MTCNFHVGQKVVFKGKENLDAYETEIRSMWISNGLTLPEDGKIYTIRAIKEGMNRRDGVVIVVLLEEVRNRSVPLYRRGFGEPGFLHEQFRPITKRKTDISQFKAMLNYQPKVVVLS